MIVQSIQLALAPVFVLVAIGNILNMLASRHARVVDRTRDMQTAFLTTTGEDHDASVRELRMLARRTVLILRAQLALVLSAITIGLTVVLIFSSQFIHASTEPFVAICFAAAIGLLLWGLVLFLMETRVASAQLRVPLSFLELDRDL